MVSITVETNENKSREWRVVVIENRIYFLLYARCQVVNVTTVIASEFCEAISNGICVANFLGDCFRTTGVLRNDRIVVERDGVLGCYPR